MPVNPYLESGSAAALQAAANTLASANAALEMEGLAETPQRAREQCERKLAFANAAERQLTELILAMPDSDVSGRAAAHHLLCEVSYLREDWARGEIAGRRAADLFEAAGDDKGVAAAVHSTGAMYFGKARATNAADDFARAHDMLSRSAHLARQCDADGIVSESLKLLGNLAATEGDFGTARDHWLAARELFAAAGDTASVRYTEECLSEAGFEVPHWSPAPASAPAPVPVQTGAPPAETRDPAAEPYEIFYRSLLLRCGLPEEQVSRQHDLMVFSIGGFLLHINLATAGYLLIRCWLLLTDDEPATANQLRFAPDAEDLVTGCIELNAETQPLVAVDGTNDILLSWHASLLDETLEIEDVSPVLRVGLSQLHDALGRTADRLGVAWSVPDLRLPMLMPEPRLDGLELARAALDAAGMAPRVIGRAPYRILHFTLDGLDFEVRPAGAEMGLFLLTLMLVGQLHPGRLSPGTFDGGIDRPLIEKLNQANLAETRIKFLGVGKGNCIVAVHRCYMTGRAAPATAGAVVAREARYMIEQARAVLNGVGRTLSPPTIPSG